jgi:hypothetical protein
VQTRFLHTNQFGPISAVARALTEPTYRRITYPRPEAHLLLKVRKGELPYKAIAEIIEEGWQTSSAARRPQRCPHGQTCMRGALALLAPQNLLSEVSVEQFTNTFDWFG